MVYAGCEVGLHAVFPMDNRKDVVNSKKRK